MNQRGVWSFTVCTGVWWPLTLFTLRNLASPPVLATKPPAASTLRMIQRLHEMEVRQDPGSSRFLNVQRIEVLRGKITNEPAGQEQRRLRFELSLELLNAGRSEEALQTITHIEQEAAGAGRGFPQKLRADLRFRKALCYLRIGEQENCLASHNPESCLFPISKNGVHLRLRGSRAASILLQEQLTEDPSDLRARWLLNLAGMTLGDYPESIPAQWLIPPDKFASDYDIKRFPDVAGALGLDLDDLAGGVVADDFDNDGFTDLLVSTWGLKGQLRLFHNEGDGHFTDRTEAAGLMGLTGGLNLIQADYNNDGFLDVLMLRGAWMGLAGRQPNSLLRNNGDGTFTDVTEEAGMLSFHPTQTAVWLDYDGDGWLDAFIGNESGEGDPHPCELYHNNHDGTFTECAALNGVTIMGFVKAVTTADYNGDGRPDLYLSIRGQANRLLRNDGPGEGGRWKFTDVALAAGVTEPIFSFPAWFFDYDNDGRPDLFVAGYQIKHVGDIAADVLGLPSEGAKAKLYRNRGDGTFEDVTVASHLDKVLHAMGSNFGDLDNDGWLDFYLATGDPEISTLIPNRMFRNAEGHFFQDVTTSGGFGHLQKGHAVAFADFDNDGDQDVFTKIGGAFTGDNYRSALFLNPGHGNHWLTLKMEGRKSNRAALGARIKVNTASAAGARSIFKTVGSGGSFGASPLRQEIGLGQATSITSVEILWPMTGQTQTLTGFDFDHFYKISEGDSKPTPWGVKKFEFDLKAHALTHPAPPNTP